MNQRILLTIFLVVAVAVFAYFISTTSREADILFTNGIIYTLNAERPRAEAIAVRSGNIVAVGNSEELLSNYKSKEVIDLGGRTAVPGFIDAHVHMNGMGQMLQSILLVGIKSPEEVAALVHERAQSLRPGEWIYGRGWDQNLWPEKRFPTKAILDAAAPDNPLILGRIDGHAIWVNSAAMVLAGVGRETKDPEGGRILRDASGDPIGIFIDNAKLLIEDVFPSPTPADIERNILTAANECVRAGLTEVHDMGCGPEIGVYRNLAEQGRLPLRVYVAVAGRQEEWNEWRKSGPLIGFAGDILTVRAMKLYMDGALGSRGAALIEDYSDDPGNRGLTLMSEAEAEAKVSEALAAGFQPCIHAIGDRGDHLALNVLEKVLNGFPKKDYRARIEHAQVLAPRDIPRFKQLHILPSMQPAHCVSDMAWAEARLGPERVKGAYAWRSLLETGITIVGGSDFPNDVMYPLWGFYAAVTRSDATGYPPDGWHGEQKMTREEALKCFTEWAAFGAFEEHRKGTIDVGKHADITVLSRDIMTIPPSAILETAIDMTVVGGKIVFDRTRIPAP
jgi:hypothetical protein